MNASRALLNHLGRLRRCHKKLNFRSISSNDGDQQPSFLNFSVDLEESLRTQEGKLKLSPSGDERVAQAVKSKESVHNARQLASLNYLLTNDRANHYHWLKVKLITAHNVVIKCNFVISFTVV